MASQGNGALQQKATKLKTQKIERNVQISCSFVEYEYALRKTFKEKQALRARLYAHF